jgi:hypothetical protein
MHGIIDADTHISESEAMWAMMDKSMYQRRPLMLSVPEDTSFGNRNAFWLIDGEIYPKPAGKGSLALCRAYNRFLANAASEAPERIKWVAVLPFGDAVRAKGAGRPQGFDDRVA